MVRTEGVEVKAESGRDGGARRVVTWQGIEGAGEGREWVAAEKEGGDGEEQAVCAGVLYVTRSLQRELGWRESGSGAWRLRAVCGDPRWRKKSWTLFGPVDHKLGSTRGLRVRRGVSCRDRKRSIRRARWRAIAAIGGGRFGKGTGGPRCSRLFGASGTGPNVRRGGYRNRVGSRGSNPKDESVPLLSAEGRGGVVDDGTRGAVARD